MRTCKGLKTTRHLTQVILIIGLMMGGSLREQQLVSASHLHPSTNYYADATSPQTESKPPTPTVEMAKPTSSSSPSPSASTTASNKRYTSITARCTDKMVVDGQFADLFKGRIYALGYPDEPECGFSTAGKEPSENITFSIPLGQCGVQMTTANDVDVESGMIHDVSLYIQYSAFLQQAVDEKISLSCMQEKPKPSSEEIEQTTSAESGKRSSRQGRRMKDPGVKSGLPKISNKIGEAWMEILSGKDPTPKSKQHSPVAVGQDITLVVSTKTSRGYDARVINCTAHDGSRTGTDGFRTQQLLDSAGCSVDRGLVPNFRRRRLPVENTRVSTIHFVTFAAFKFPERDHLHIKCAVAYCQGPCPQETCDSGRNHFGSWREKYGRIAEVLVDTSDVVNSLEILAPELEEDAGGHHYERHQSAGIPSSESTGAASNSNSNNNNNNGGYGGTSHQFSDSQQLFYTSSSGGGGGSNNGGQQWATNNNGQIPQSSGPNVCISPGTVILALVILGVVLVISATATLWFALKRSELKKLQMKQAYQHGHNPYYRFSQPW